MSICGLDFGTSNTTLGTIDGAAPVLAALEETHTAIPSAIFYEADGGVRIGRARRGTAHPRVADRRAAGLFLVALAEDRLHLRERHAVVDLGVGVVVHLLAGGH